MTDLVVIVPSRGRPEAAAEVARAFEETCTADTRLVFALDRDDQTVGNYPDVTTITGSNRSMVEALNRAANYFAGSAFALGFMGDDHRPRTQGWDKQYLDALRDLGTGLVYGNDLLQGERLPTQVAMTTNIVEAFGYMVPPGLQHMYVDNAWKMLGEAMGRITYLPDVIIEHCHPLAGKAEWDEGYARVNDPGVYARDEAIYRAWLSYELPLAMDKLRTLIDA